MWTFHLSVVCMYAYCCKLGSNISKVVSIIDKVGLSRIVPSVASYVTSWQHVILLKVFAGPFFETLQSCYSCHRHYIVLLHYSLHYLLPVTLLGQCHCQCYKPNPQSWVEAKLIVHHRKSSRFHGCNTTMWRENKSALTSPQTPGSSLKFLNPILANPRRI